MKKAYLGIDIGSVSTNLVLIDEKNNVLDSLYIRTQGNPINTIKNGLKKLKDNMTEELKVSGVGTTGSGRNLGGIMVGSDVVKNEITAHARAAIHFVPNVNTILEIGGQDSKIILLRDGILHDFGMNTVCAAGTGSFLDRQAERLGIPIEDFGHMALNSKSKIRIAGRCAVFAESDMIHKQQLGHNQEDIINGLCEALARNYLNNLGKGKTLNGPIVFQGGVAANKGIVRAFEELLGEKILVPPYHHVMGAVGVALLAKEEVAKTKRTNFTGFEIANSEYTVSTFECNHCPNLCEVVKFYKDDTLISNWGDKCGRWSNSSCTDEKFA
ncbi:acyl-CoA dehydratase activase [Anaeromicrobium sediminis]|uniref:2-hydroxyglutaryl-CoA dehydratase n=1 Tax=Anaeromicrobium sediminis TaxID=1478221 RepID=A0A267ME54_9FIRM|nr:acyl-CoA dehydratase activase [Anaeromicrobium sediminis]PAB57861.1 2-hydroxyglutaryl-CoA dehydratase [Anaeromicrobium sediminis]